MKWQFFKEIEFGQLFLIGITVILTSALYAEDCATELPDATQFNLS